MRTHSTKLLEEAAKFGETPKSIEDDGISTNISVLPEKCAPAGLEKTPSNCSLLKTPESSIFEQSLSKSGSALSNDSTNAALDSEVIGSSPSLILPTVETDGMEMSQDDSVAKPELVCSRKSSTVEANLETLFVDHSYCKNDSPHSNTASLKNIEEALDSGMAETSASPALPTVETDGTGQTEDESVAKPALVCSRKPSKVEETHEALFAEESSSKNDFDPSDDLSNAATLKKVEVASDSVIMECSSSLILPTVEIDGMEQSQDESVTKSALICSRKSSTVQETLEAFFAKDSSSKNDFVSLDDPPNAAPSKKIEVASDSVMTERSSSLILPTVETDGVEQSQDDSAANLPQVFSKKSSTVQETLESLFAEASYSKNDFASADDPSTNALSKKIEVASDSLIIESSPSFILPTVETDGLKQSSDDSVATPALVCSRKSSTVMDNLETLLVEDSSCKNDFPNSNTASLKNIEEALDSNMPESSISPMLPAIETNGMCQTEDDSVAKPALVRLRKSSSVEETLEALFAGVSPSKYDIASSNSVPSKKIEEALDSDMVECSSPPTLPTVAASSVKMKQTLGDSVVRPICIRSETPVTAEKILETLISGDSPSKNQSASPSDPSNAASLKNIDSTLNSVVIGSSSPVTLPTVETDSVNKEHSPERPALVNSDKFPSAEEIITNTMTVETDTSCVTPTGLQSSPRNRNQAEECASIILADEHTSTGKPPEISIDCGTAKESTPKDGSCVLKNAEINPKSSEKTFDEKGKEERRASHKYINGKNAALKKICEDKKALSPSQKIFKDKLYVLFNEEISDEKHLEIVSEAAARRKPRAASTVAIETDAKNDDGSSNDPLNASSVDPIDLKKSPASLTQTEESASSIIAGADEKILGKSVDGGGTAEKSWTKDEVSISKNTENRAASSGSAIDGRSEEEKKAERQYINEKKAEFKIIGKKFCEDRKIPFPNQKDFKNMIYVLFKDKILDEEHLKVALEAAAQKKPGGPASAAAIETVTKNYDGPSNDRLKASSVVPIVLEKSPKNSIQSEESAPSIIATAHTSNTANTSGKSIVGDTAEKGWTKDENCPESSGSTFDGKSEEEKKTERQYINEKIAEFKIIGQKFCEERKIPFLSQENFTNIIYVLYKAQILDEEHLKITLEAVAKKMLGGSASRSTAATKSDTKYDYGSSSKQSVVPVAIEKSSKHSIQTVESESSIAAAAHLPNTEKSSGKSIDGATAEEVGTKAEARTSKAERQYINDKKAEFRVIGKQFCEDKKIPFPNQKDFKNMIYVLFKDKILDEEHLKIALEAAAQKKLVAPDASSKNTSKTTTVDDNASSELSSQKFEKTSDESAAKEENDPECLRVPIDERNKRAKMRGMKAKFRIIGKKFCETKNIPFPKQSDFNGILDDLIATLTFDEKHLKIALEAAAKKKLVVPDTSSANASETSTVNDNVSSELSPSKCENTSDGCATKKEKDPKSLRIPIDKTPKMRGFPQNINAMKARFRIIGQQFCEAKNIPFPKQNAFNCILEDLIATLTFDEKHLKIALEAAAQQRRIEPTTNSAASAGSERITGGDDLKQSSVKNTKRVPDTQPDDEGLPVAKKTKVLTVKAQKYFHHLKEEMRYIALMHCHAIKSPFPERKFDKICLDLYESNMLNEKNIVLAVEMEFKECCQGPPSHVQLIFILKQYCKDNHIYCKNEAIMRNAILPRVPKKFINRKHYWALKYNERQTNLFWNEPLKKAVWKAVCEGSNRPAVLKNKHGTTCGGAAEPKLNQTLPAKRKAQGKDMVGKVEQKEILQATGSPLKAPIKGMEDPPRLPRGSGGTHSRCSDEEDRRVGKKSRLPGGFEQHEIDPSKKPRMKIPKVQGQPEDIHLLAQPYVERQPYLNSSPHIQVSSVPHPGNALDQFNNQTPPVMPPHSFPLSAPISSQPQGYFLQSNFPAQTHFIPHSNIGGQGSVQPWPVDPSYLMNMGLRADIPEGHFWNTGFPEHYQTQSGPLQSHIYGYENPIIGTSEQGRGERERISTAGEPKSSLDDSNQGMEECSSKSPETNLSCSSPTISSVSPKPRFQNDQNQSPLVEDVDSRHIVSLSSQDISGFDGRLKAGKSVDLERVMNEFDEWMAKNAGESKKPGSSSRRKVVRASPSRVEDESYVTKIEESPPFVGPGKSCKVAVVHEDYPKRLLTHEEAGLIQTALLERIGAQSGVGPRFSDTFEESGAVVFDCEDQVTVSWVWVNAFTIKPWSNSMLRPTSWEKPPKEISIDIPTLLQSLSPQGICERLVSQNPGLSTENWKLKLSDTTVPKNKKLVFTIDEPSLETIKSLDLRLYLGFSRVNVQVTQE